MPALIPAVLLQIELQTIGSMDVLVLLYVSVSDILNILQIVVVHISS